MNRLHATLIGSTLVLASLAGCSGQGNYTRQGVSMAKERMSFLKSATEWELARQAFLAGDLDKALVKVDVSLDINDTVVKSHVLKGRILIEMGDLGNALKSLRTAATLNPEESDAQYYLGVIFERLNRPEDAYTHFDLACEYDDYNPSYAVAAAEMLIDIDRVEQAKVYLVSIPMAQNNAGIRQSLGHIALLENSYEEAVRFFNQARLLAPDDDGIMEDLIHSQMLAHDFGDAERNISLLLKNTDNEDRRDLQILHAKALLNTGRPVEARSIYQEMVSTAEGKSDVDSWIGLANSSFIVNDMRTVRKAASRIVALDPSSHEGYLLYAMYHRQAEDFQSSLSSIDSAATRNPLDAGIHAFRAMVLKDLNMNEQAVASLARAVELEPGNPQFTQMLAQYGNSTFASVPTDQ
jgi:Flp pilus assembly protein TadD